MPEIKWTLACSVGCEELDADHKQIFLICDQLRCLLTEYKTVHDQANFESRINLGLKALSSVLQAHFDNEEFLLSQSAYPDLENHQALHKDCLAFFEAILCDKGSLVAKAKHVEDFIKAWVFQHILVDDMRYKPWLDSQQN